MRPVERIYENKGVEGTLRVQGGLKGGGRNEDGNMLFEFMMCAPSMILKTRAHNERFKKRA